MHTLSPRGGFTIACCFLVSSLVADEPRKTPEGHSTHGEAFDDGPRQQAKLLPNQGDVRFPVTTANPESQRFFNQGVAQLHTFYYYEAERSFRQAFLLDPKATMALWGMAMANVNNGGRARTFIARTEGKREHLTDRERKWIDALAALYDESKKDDERRPAYVRGLEAVIYAYPDEIEAKAFLAWTLIGSPSGGERVFSRVAVSSLIQDVLDKNPHHPGAHHYRIHLFDNDDRDAALQSALAYHHAAMGIAHAWHMPGHIYNGMSRFKDASWQQDASSHVDHAHLAEWRIMPFEIHNYAHNQHYLIANLNHLGRVRDAIDFARNLVVSPRDPQKNEPNGGWSAQRLGRISLLSLYARYEMWQDLLGDPHLDWSENSLERGWQAYGRASAHFALGDAAKAKEESDRLEKLAQESAKKPNHETNYLECARCEVRGRMLVAEGKLLEGFELLQKAQKLQQDHFRGDLSGYPRLLNEVLGQAHLAAKDWGMAEAYFADSLERRKNTLPSLAGLVEARVQAGKLKDAADALVRYRAAQRDADQGLVFDARVEPFAAKLAGVDPSRNEALATAQAPTSDRPIGELGPRLWEPFDAPAFSAVDENGKRVSLEELRGSNVLLFVYLGSDCQKCLEALSAFGKEKAAFDGLHTRILALSDDPPDVSRKLIDEKPPRYTLPFSLLSDPRSEIARSLGARDTFEDIPLHGAFLIDANGKVRWQRIAAEPFSDVAFLKTEIARVNAIVEAARAAAKKRSF